MQIKQIRNDIQTLGWARNEFTGGTVEENKRLRLPSALAPYIAAVEALVIPPRFVKDIEARAFQLQAAADVIARWEAAQ